MSSTEDLLRDPFNCCQSVWEALLPEEKGEVEQPDRARKQQLVSVRFPLWISELLPSKKPEWVGTDFQPRLNYSLSDHVINLQASVYDASVWYPWLASVPRLTPDSVLIQLADDEIHRLIYEQELSTERRGQVMALVDKGYRFVKSSKKSSHFKKRVKNYDQLVEELTHPQVVTSFKDGCRHLFLRQYVPDLQDEYRVYVYDGRPRYVERYLAKPSPTNEDVEDTVSRRVLPYVETRVLPVVKYRDFVLDVATSSTFDPQTGLVCIEINTPAYLFAGLQFANYARERDVLHQTLVPIVRY